CRIHIGDRTDDGPDAGARIEGRGGRTRSEERRRRGRGNREREGCGELDAAGDIGHHDSVQRQGAADLRQRLARGQIGGGGRVVHRGDRNRNRTVRRACVCGIANTGGNGEILLVISRRRQGHGGQCRIHIGDRTGHRPDASTRVVGRGGRT